MGLGRNVFKTRNVTRFICAQGKQAQRLHSVMMQIHDRCPHANVLIMGSKHMLKWAGINQVKRRAVIYLLDNE